MSEYIISFGPNAKSTDVYEHSRGILKEIMESSKIFSVTISSTARDAYDQARVMYDNLSGTGDGKGVDAQKALYAAAGDSVIDVYVSSVASKLDRNGTIAAMKAKIIEIGPTKVSKHATDVSKLNVFDVAPSGIPADKKKAWEDAISSHSGISNYIFPPGDPGYHFEIAQPQATS